MFVWATWPGAHVPGVQYFQLKNHSLVCFSGVDVLGKSGLHVTLHFFFFLATKEHKITLTIRCVFSVLHSKHFQVSELLFATLQFLLTHEVKAADCIYFTQSCGEKHKPKTCFLSKTYFTQRREVKLYLFSFNCPTRFFSWCTSMWFQAVNHPSSHSQSEFNR